MPLYNPNPFKTTTTSYMAITNNNQTSLIINHHNNHNMSSILTHLLVNLALNMAMGEATRNGSIKKINNFIMYAFFFCFSYFLMFLFLYFTFFLLSSPLSLIFITLFIYFDGYDIPFLFFLS